ncbi:MAG: short-chain dehydrogenase/reductase [Actinomycetota bacterium]|nr:short-chain dehydrogenase/reductase [Actinomycetota bacterium]
MEPVEVPLDLREKVVLITGGARGIGLETARIARERGASVALVDLDPELVAESAKSLGDGVIGIGGDVTSLASMEAAIGAARDEFGRVDVVIANAGITPPKTTARAIDPAIWEKVVEVNLFGVWRTVRAAMSEVIRNRGQFALISSSYAHANGIFNSSYAASKAGVEALGRGLAAELAPHGAGVTVAYFGFVKTDLIGEIFDNPVADRFRDEMVPGFLTTKMEVQHAAGALLDGISAREPRVIEPRAWRPPFYLRGQIGPLSDRRLETDPRVGTYVEEMETQHRDDLPASSNQPVRAGNPYPLAGKVVLVTGAARGIGWDVARQAHGRGASVVLVDQDPGVEEAAAGLGPRSLAVSADVTESSQLDAAVAEAKARFGRVDVVVANAGIAPPTTTVEAIDVSDWERVLEVNLLGVWRTVRAGMDEVVANGGQFVLLSSSYAFMNGVFSTPYATAKAGVEALGRALRAELMPLGASATVAYFGWIRTEMVRAAFADPVGDRFRKSLPAFLTRQVPVSRAGGAIIKGIEHRAPRVIAPLEWKVLFYSRGLLGPLTDRRFAADPTIADLVRELSAEGS